MAEVLTFSQCLIRIMQRYQMTATTLAPLVGGRADLKRILADESTDSKRKQLYEKLKRTGLFRKEDYQQLELSLEISRIGLENYKFNQAIESILNGKPTPRFSPLMTDQGVPLQERLAELNTFDKIDIICVNSCFHSVIAALLPLFADQNDVHMWHLIHSDAFANTASSFVSVTSPLLFDVRYQPYGMEIPAEEDVYALGGNFIVIRASTPDVKKDFFFLVVNDTLCCEMTHADEGQLFSFIAKVLRALSPQPFLLKEPHSSQIDFTSICMNYLSHELNRATYSLANDLSFQQTPSDIAVAALQDKGMFSAEEISDMIKRTLAIHEQRYQNQYNKRKPTYRIMTVRGCQRFLETGYCSDHFVGFRAFTPYERKRIFGEIIQQARENEFFIPLLIRDHSFQYRYNLVCYDKLSVSLDMTDTDYDIAKGYRSVFLTFPAFTQQYMNYYLSTLVKEKCHSSEESLQLLEDMYQTFLTEYHL